MKVNLLGAIAIPVGHRVTVRWFRKTSKGLFGGTSEDRHFTQPQVEDLTTGVVYAFKWHYDNGDFVKDEEGYSSDIYPSTWSETLGKGVVEDRAVTGTIAACRIFTWLDRGGGGGNAHLLPETELTLTPEGGYRE